METAELVKTFLKVEEECRALRADVAVLERARRYQVSDTSTIALSTDKATTVSRNGKPRTVFIPIEAVGEVNNKAGELTLLINKRQRLLQERKHLESVLQQTAIQVAEAEEENNKYNEAIGLTGNESLFRVKDKTETVFIANQLKCEIENALNDRDAIQATLTRQNCYLKQMATQLSTTDNIEKDREAALQQLAEKREELKSIREEKYAIKRLLGRKEAMLEKEKPVDEVAIVKSAETDRSVVLHKLGREREAVRLNNLSIRHRALQIARLERRIEMIGDAVGGEESAGEERVDAELLEQLRKEIISLTLLHFDGSVRLERLDSNIVDLDRRAAGLVRTTANVQKEMKRIEKEHKKYTNAQRKELELEHAATEEEIKYIEKEVEVLRQLTSRSGPQEGH
ncbi:hypothetical protein ERJ75_000191900 [Trypanosoma vivax]|uniref:Uncharacterized protein n=1 Tax=Trypanosoma vivax (strain Y486) TaxID=1055687 RepID=G0UA58_TRYVY|nr:hypothetical protein TRVL_08902 [Trypanosoma vivax]KAH8619017.1 hypothetical protein ERJ75_000191900 [Trypanosoma vivax]CCC52690.1 conserved hypothetical protein [Trypanosoma vivax Y486]